MVNALKLEAESQSDSEQQKKLLAAAKMLADATARMVEAAKVTVTFQCPLNISLSIRFRFPVTCLLKETTNGHVVKTFSLCLNNITVKQ